jgi:hypothetical protein
LLPEQPGDELVHREDGESAREQDGHLTVKSLAAPDVVIAEHENVRPREGHAKLAQGAQRARQRRMTA